MSNSYYGSLSSAETYFNGKVATAAWDNSIVTKREAALVQATRAIDQLNLAGDKTDSNQELQFPRGGDTIVPTAVEYACYEEAIRLLDGADPEHNLSTLGVVSDAFSGVRVTYDVNHAPPHILCGLTSQQAFIYLRPFIKQVGGVKLSRGS